MAASATAIGYATISGSDATISVIVVSGSTCVFAISTVATQVAAMAAGRAVHWSVRMLADDGFLGCCSLTDIDRWHKRAEVGFLLGRDAWGQGLGVEAVRAIVGYAGASGLRKLAARTHLGNRRSESLLGKLGFKQEGLLRGHIVRDSERRDCRLFGLLL